MCRSCAVSVAPARCSATRSASATILTRTAHSEALIVSGAGCDDNETFGRQHYEGVVPDMVTFAKGISGAWMPLAGVGVRKPIQDFCPRPPGAVKRPQRSAVFFYENPFCMGLSYGRAGRLTALFGGFRPGQSGRTRSAGGPPSGPPRGG